MHIIDYKYIHGTLNNGSSIVIPELDRGKASVQQFINLADLNITLDKPTAFLYIDGASRSPSESTLNTVAAPGHVIRVKSVIAYVHHEWVKTFEGKEHLVKVDVMTGTCAAGIQAMYEANRLLNDGVIKEVIIIGSERITEHTKAVFSELQMPITCGDGFVYMRLCDTEEGCRHDIYDVQWKYTHQRNPFSFTKDTLNTLIPDYQVDYIKLHATGTASNTAAEADLANIAKPITYKDAIGHTQGVSSLIETCLVLDDPSISGKVLVVANGLGGFYGSFTLIK